MGGTMRSTFVRRAVSGLVGGLIGGLLGPTLCLWLMLGRHTLAELGMSFVGTISILLNYFSPDHYREGEEYVALVPFLPSALIGTIVGILAGGRRKRGINGA